MPNEIRSDPGSLPDSPPSRLRTGPDRAETRPVFRLRLPRMARWLCILALLPTAAHSQPRGDYAARLAELESVMDSCYRGDNLKYEQGQIDSLTQSFNREVERRNASVAKAHATLESRSASLAELKRQIDIADKSLEQQPAASDRDAINAYNARLRDRNALAARFGELADKLKTDVEARKAAEDRYDAELAAQRAAVEADHRHLKERGERLKAFNESDEPMLFFCRLNRLLADVKSDARAGFPQPELLEHVRRLRRELAAWATRGEEMDGNGHVVVPAVIGDEPCWFIVDTGAHATTLSLEIVEALGLSGSLGEEVKIVVVGGGKVNARHFEIPQLSVAGVTEADIPAAAVAPSSVGLDGLLGQTFLKRFVYTIDERRPEKLLLTRR